LIFDRDNIIDIQLDVKPLQSLGELPCPVCLFFFTLENDQAYYQQSIAGMTVGTVYLYQDRFNILSIPSPLPAQGRAQRRSRFRSEQARTS
jgi:hypothetical protein